MSVNEVFIQNFQTIRSRSLKLWMSLPEEILCWRPNPTASTGLEVIRLVLETEILHYMFLLQQPAKDSDVSPISHFSFSTVDNEIRQSLNYREKFLKLLHNYKKEDFQNLKFDIGNGNKSLPLSEYLLIMMRQESEYYGLLQAYSRLYNGKEMRA